MMGHFRFMVFICLFISLKLSANFSGLWKGFGKVHINGQNQECNHFKVEFEHTESFLITSGSTLNCKGINIIGKPNTLNIFDGKLYFGAKLIGTISDLNIETKFIDQVNGFNYEYRLNLLGETIIDYSETVTSSSGSLFYQVHAYLKKDLNFFQ